MKATTRFELLAEYARRHAERLYARLVGAKDEAAERRRQLEQLHAYDAESFADKCLGRGIEVARFLTSRKSRSVLQNDDQKHEERFFLEKLNINSVENLRD
jgi:hypothetical protein